MTLSVCIFSVTCLLMILSVLFFPKIRLGGISLDTYILIVPAGAVAMILAKCVTLRGIITSFTADTAVNPVKILILFISMTILSVYLDEVGFFSYVANAVLAGAGKSQMRLFVILYAVVSVLTVFTSNDIIILTFTPFICYFAKHAKIDPIPYLISEFVAANTWSMALVIGNPTNIFLDSAAGIDFLTYLSQMILPTFSGGVCALFVLLLMFRRKLEIPIRSDLCPETPRLPKAELTVGLLHLSICTLLLAIGGYIGIPMWIVAFGFSVDLVLCALVISIIRHRRPTELLHCLRRAPWQLIPFVLAMFVLILGLDASGATALLSDGLGERFPVLSYGVSSFLFCNLMNNIPMSVLFSSVMGNAPQAIRTAAVYATIIGSNLGALFTPIGALAGIMWSSLLKKQDVKMNYAVFVKYVGVVAVPTLLSALAVLALEV